MYSIVRILLFIFSVCCLAWQLKNRGTNTEEKLIELTFVGQC